MSGAPGQPQGPIPGQTAHLSEEQKRMMLIKQKVLNQNMPYSAMQPHGQVRHCSWLWRPRVLWMAGESVFSGWAVWLSVLCLTGVLL